MRGYVVDDVGQALRPPQKKKKKKSVRRLAAGRAAGKRGRCRSWGRSVHTTVRVFCHFGTRHGTRRFGPANVCVGDNT